MARLWSLLALLVLLTAGCVAPPTADPRPPQDPAPGVGSEPPARELPNITIQVVDLRQNSLDAPRVRFDLTFDAPLDNATSLYTGWRTAADGHPTGGIVAIPANSTAWNVTYDLPMGHGNHSLTALAGWSDGTPDTAYTAAFTHTVWAPVRLVLNASERYAQDQNVFHTDHLVPFAPWDEESALHILRRAADTYGFQVKTHYRADLDSHFVDAINGTAFRWEFPEAAGISRNWMVLLDDEATATAIDDTRPETGQTIEFRYVRCYATGNCDDL